MAITLEVVVLVIAYATYDILVVVAMFGGLFFVAWLLARAIIWVRKRRHRRLTLPNVAHVGGDQTDASLVSAEAQHFLLALSSDAVLGPVFRIRMVRGEWVCSPPGTQTSARARERFECARAAPRDASSIRFEQATFHLSCFPRPSLTRSRRPASSHRTAVVLLWKPVHPAPRPRSLASRGLSAVAAHGLALDRRRRGARSCLAKNGFPLWRLRYSPSPPVVRHAGSFAVPEITFSREGSTFPALRVLHLLPRETLLERVRLSTTRADERSTRRNGRSLSCGEHCDAVVKGCLFLIFPCEGVSISHLSL